MNKLTACHNTVTHISFNNNNKRRFKDLHNGMLRTHLRLSLIWQKFFSLSPNSYACHCMCPIRVISFVMVMRRTHKQTKTNKQRAFVSTLYKCVIMHYGTHHYFCNQPLFFLHIDSGLSVKNQMTNPERSCGLHWRGIACETLIYLIPGF